MEISRIQDKYSPVFFNRLTNGKAFVEMTLTVLTVNHGTVLTRVFYDFSDLLLEAYLPRSGGFNKDPVESLTFIYRDLKVDL